MIYEFMCKGECGKIRTVECKLSEYETIKAHITCCGSKMEHLFTVPRQVFAREGFPKGYEITEHCMDEPIFCKDKKQLEDICAESNTVSRYLEDDV